MEDILSLTTREVLLIFFLPFLKPKLENFLSLITHEMLSKFFAFFGAIIEFEDFLPLPTYEFLPNSLVFLEPKLEDLKHMTTQGLLEFYMDGTVKNTFIKPRPTL